MQLLKGKFILRRKLAEQLQPAKDRLATPAFSRRCSMMDWNQSPATDPTTPSTYPADMALYPARTYFRVDTMRFRKHYYPVSGAWKTPKGVLIEEFLCTQQIDLLDEAEFWVRILVHASKFWMPTAMQRTYTDFVVKLKDGRLLVVEYKGEDRYSSDE